MPETVSIGPKGQKIVCCNMVRQPKTSFFLRIGGLPLPGIPITSFEEFSSWVTEYFLTDDMKLKYKVTGQMPGENVQPTRIKTQQELDSVMAAGGEINIIFIHIPIVGSLLKD